METQPKLTNSKDVIAYLVKQFPACFIAEGEAKPLKIGIFKDLIERLPNDSLVSKTQLRAALRLYTSSWRYLYGLKQGAERIDLDGNNCGLLEQTHIDFAKNQLEQAKARIKAKKREQIRSSNEDESESSKPKKAKPAAKATRVKSEPLTPSTKSKKGHKGNNKGQQVSSAKNQWRALSNKDVDNLIVGQTVRVKVGKEAIDAVILEINKDAVRVQLVSGLSLTVQPKHFVK